MPKLQKMLRNLTHEEQVRFIASQYNRMIEYVERLEYRIALLEKKVTK